MNRFDFSFGPATEATVLKVCMDFVSEPVPTGYVYVDVSFAPSLGSVGIILSATEPCANVPIPKGAVTVTAHDLTVPQWSDDLSDVIP